MESFFPDVQGWIWVLFFTVICTGIVYMTMRGTSHMNSVLLVLAIVAMVVFVAMVVIQLVQGEEAGALVSATPFIDDNVELGLILTGATMVCLSFIGIDAFTMYVEEARTPKVVPRAIMLTVLVGGQTLKIVLTAACSAATITSLLASQASVARMLLSVLC